MLCPKCQAATAVIRNRMPDVNGNDSNQDPMVDRGLQLFGWWTDEILMRDRECGSCGHRFMTIEIMIDDLRDALAEVIREGVLSPFMSNEHYASEEDRLKE